MQYWSNLGIMLGQWLPIVALMFFACRYGVERGIRAYEESSAQKVRQDATFKEKPDRFSKVV